MSTNNSQLDYMDQFDADALRTESIVSEILVDATLLSDTISCIVNATNVLDMLKKNIFYGKEIDEEALDRAASGAALFGLSMSGRTVNEKQLLHVNPRVFHSIIGIATESAELLEALPLGGQPIDAINIGEEWGDMCWYGSLMLNELGFTWEQILVTLINKLKQRYPEKFDSDKAINRDVSTERQHLDAGLSNQ